MAASKDNHKTQVRTPFLPCQDMDHLFIFHGERNTGIVPRPCSVPLNGLKQTHKDCTLNTTLFLRGVTFIHIHIWKFLDPCFLLGHPTLAWDVFNLDKTLQLQQQMPGFVFISMEFLRLIACMMASIWPYEPGWVVYITLYVLHDLMYLGHPLKGKNRVLPGAVHVVVVTSPQSLTQQIYRFQYNHLQLLAKGVTGQTGDTHRCTAPCGHHSREKVGEGTPNPLSVTETRHPSRLVMLMQCHCCPVMLVTINAGAQTEL